MILSALGTQPCLMRINYVNNEIGTKSIAELEKMLNPNSPNQLTDLRFNRVRSTKNDLNLLINCLS